LNKKDVDQVFIFTTKIRIPWIEKNGDAGHPCGGRPYVDKRLPAIAAQNEIKVR
jgi:hypothetical protein